MTTPRRGLLFHFTHVDNLPAIAANGLLCDRSSTSRGLLATDIDTIVERTLPFVFTDRNAVIDYAKFGTRIDDLDDFVDWPLMEARYWNNTPTDPDRMARRMAEFLVHRRVPWEAFIELAARTAEDAARAQASLAKVNADGVVQVRQDWYF